jgi:hypothetical protein
MQPKTGRKATRSWRKIVPNGSTVRGHVGVEDAGEDILADERMNAQRL